MHRPQLPSHDVVLYLFSGIVSPALVASVSDEPPDPLSPDLTRLLVASPPDIALAVRVKREGDGVTAVTAREPDETLQERLGEIGLDLVDESAVDDDDGRRESVRSSSSTSPG